MIKVFYAFTCFQAHAWGNLFASLMLDRESENRTVDLQLCGYNFCPYVERAGENIEQPSKLQVNDKGIILYCHTNFSLIRSVEICDNNETCGIHYNRVQTSVKEETNSTLS